MEEPFVITKLLHIVKIGEDAYTDRHISFSPNLSCSELVFHFSGQTTICFGEMTLHTRSNTVRFLPKGNASKYEVYIHEPDECIAIAFQTDVPVSDGPFVLDASKNPKLLPLFRKIFTAWSSKESGYYFQCVSLLYSIFSEMQRENHSPPGHRRKIAPAVDAILSGFLHEALTVPELAEMCGMSESYFKRLFKEIYHISPRKYMIHLKLNHACDLLRLQRYTVTQIAEMCNFSDVCFFSRQFKSYMGISPTDFARKYASG